MIMKVFKLALNLSFWILSISWFGVACTPNSSKETMVGPNLEMDDAKAKELENQLDVVLAQKGSWRNHWIEFVGPFQAANFKMVLTDSIDPQEMPEKNPILNDDPLFPYQFIHPSSNGTMDIYSYKIEAQDAIDTPYLNPDSEVIWYRADGMKERLLFMGPSGMFEEGQWISEDEFVVLGYFQEELGFRPMLWFIDVEQHIFRQFALETTAPNYELGSYLDQKIKQVALN